MRDPHVRLAGEQKPVGRRRHPVFERGRLRQLAKCVIDLHRVQPGRVVLEEILRRKLLRVKIRFPACVSESGGPLRKAAAILSGYTEVTVHPHSVERSPSGKHSRDKAATPKRKQSERLREIWPDLREMILPRRKLLALGLVLMIINRLSGMVLPYSTRVPDR